MINYNRSIFLVCFVVVLFFGVSSFAYATESTSWQLSEDEHFSLQALKSFLNKTDEMGDFIWPGYVFSETTLVMQGHDHDYVVNLSPPSRAADTIDYHSLLKVERSIKHEGMRLMVRSEKFYDMPAGCILPIMADGKLIMFCAYLPTRDRANESYKSWGIDLELDYDLFMVSWLHEAFHVFQMHNWQPFKNEICLNQKDYIDGLKDDRIYPLMKVEGRSLFLAMTAISNEATLSHLRKFFKVRATRRNYLSEKTVRVERIFELVEGTAQYVERKAAIFLMIDPPDGDVLPNYHHFTNGIDIYREKLQKVVDLDYAGHATNANWGYNWGMAQAIILDRLYPQWKREMNKQVFFLEDKLRELCGKSSENK